MECCGCLPRARVFFARVCAFAAGGALLAASGCQSAPRPDDARGEPRASEQRVPSNAPVFSDRHRGLEVQSWLAPNDTADIARVLEPFEAEPLPAEPWTIERWRRSGIRVLSVPLDRLDELRSTLDQAGSLQSRWLGEATDWIAVVEGPDLPAGQIATEDGPVEVDGGRLRLLVRSWVTPMLGNSGVGADGFGAGVYVEIAPQHTDRVDPLRRAGFDARLAPKPRDPLDEGLVFRRLGLAGVLPAERAILFVAEFPATDWGEVARAAEDAERSEQNTQAELEDGVEVSGPSPGPEAEETAVADGVGPVWTPTPWSGLDVGAGGEVAGPEPPRPPWLGEAMLTSEPGHGSGRYRELGSRLIVVLVPRVPAEFDLLGAASR